jgi:hypothetical protein
MEFYYWPPYLCSVMVDGERRIAEKPDKQLTMALTLYSLAGKLGEPVTPKLKAYIKSKTRREGTAKDHGTETTERIPT